MSSRTKNKVPNYAEVDSDVDLDSDGGKEEGEGGVASSSRGGARGKGDTYATTSKPSKKKRKIKTNKIQQLQDPQGPPSYSKKLSDLNFDVLSMVTTYLKGEDVISLAKVDKSLHRRLTVGSDADQIWSDIRRRGGFELPNGMSELKFATLMYGLNCQNCGQITKEKSNFYLQTHLCRFCEKALLISDFLISRDWKKIHPQAKKCVRFYNTYGDFNYEGMRQSYLYLVTELEEAHHKLCELEVEDETSEMNNEFRSSATSRSISSRSRRQNYRVDPGPEQTTRVTSFVEECQTWIAKQQEDASKLVKEIKSRGFAKRQAEQAELIRQIRSGVYPSNRFVRDFGWTQEEAQHYLRVHQDVDFGSDEEAWEEHHKVVKKEVARRARRRERESERYHRASFVKDQWKTLKRNSTSPELLIFPNDIEFHALPSVRALWYPVGAVVNSEVWEEALPKVEEEVRSVYLEAVRVETARALVSARDDIDLSELSEDPVDYPLSDYGDDFFSLATSLFTTRRKGRDIVGLTSFQYPSTTAIEFDTKKSFHRYTNFRQIHLITAILEAAGLDPDFATLGDLESLQGEWIWTNHPKKAKRRDTFDWFSLLDEALAEAPSGPKLRSGKVVRFKYIPSQDEE
ncbi:hypothetical protein JCM3765_000335 [Sporobolomyces pararoseus]